MTVLSYQQFYKIFSSTLQNREVQKFSVCNLGHRVCARSSKSFLQLNMMLFYRFASAMSQSLRSWMIKASMFVDNQENSTHHSVWSRRLNIHYQWWCGPWCLQMVLDVSTLFRERWISTSISKFWNRSWYPTCRSIFRMEAEFSSRMVHPATQRSQWQPSWSRRKFQYFHGLAIRQTWIRLKTYGWLSRGGLLNASQPAKFHWLRLWSMCGHETQKLKKCVQNL